VDVVFACLAILAGLVALEVGAEHFTSAVGGLARRLRASEGTVGLLTAGGEWEELVVVSLAIASGHSGLAVGNVVGACLANLIGSMPLGMLARTPLRPDRSARIYGLVMVAVTAVVAALTIGGGRISRLEGGFLVALFVAYVVSVVVVIRRGLLRPPDSEEDDGDDATDASKLRLAITLAVSLAVICGAAEAVVLGAVHIAHVVGLSDYAIGATVVAVGTTLPDKAISFLGGRRGQSGVVTANATGSNIFLLTLVLGLVALSSGSGLRLSHAVATVDVPLLVAASAAVAALFFRRSLHWRTGTALLTLYVGYVAFVLVRR
jgi:Ca2+/Na+ antiporter